MTTPLPPHYDGPVEMTFTRAFRSVNGVVTDVLESTSRSVAQMSWQSKALVALYCLTVLLAFAVATFNDGLEALHAFDRVHEGTAAPAGARYAAVRDECKRVYGHNFWKSLLLPHSVVSEFIPWLVVACNLAPSASAAGGAADAPAATAGRPRRG